MTVTVTVTVTVTLSSCYRDRDRDLVNTRLENLPVHGGSVVKFDQFYADTLHSREQLSVLCLFLVKFILTMCPK